MKKEELAIYRKLFDHMIDMVLIIAQNGTILYGNKSASEFYGYSEDALKEHRIHDFRVDEEKGYIEQQIKQAAEGGLEFETIHLNREGKYVPVKVRAVSVEGSSSGTVVSIVQDMSKIKGITNKSKIFDVSLSISHEPIIVFDLDFRITIWNQAAECRFGYTKDEMLGKKINAITPEEEIEQMAMVVKLLKVGQKIEKIETSRFHKSGHRVAFVVSYSPVFDQNENIIGYVGIYDDISELKRLNQKIEEHQNRATLALEGEKFCIWDINMKESSFELYNNMNRLMGYAQNEKLDNYQKWLLYIHPDDVDNVLQEADKQIKAGQSFSIEYRTQLSESQYTWVLSKGKIISMDENNKPVRILGTTEDISERKAYEKSLLDMNRELERLVQETANANAAKSQFLANMSHELRTPLNGIISTIQLLEKETEFNASQKKLMDILVYSSISLRDMLTDILDYSKFENKGLKVNNKEIDLKSMMTSVFNALQTGANMKEIEVGYYFDPRIDFNVFADAPKIAQILNNLISNAIKFTESGTISLKTKLVGHRDGKATISFELTDTGIGIDADQIGSIYDAFTQLDASTHKVYSGTGLGLSICKQLAEGLGGKINCESEIGKGSKFTFVCEMEIVESNDSNNKSLEPLNHPSTLQPSHLSSRPKRVVLSVDDNTMNQSVLAFIIEKMGHTLLCAYNADEAIEALKSEKIDLILMDIQMPVTNGYKLTETIRKMDGYKDIPIIAMTAYSMTEDKEKCLGFGMNDFIIKPFDIDYLKNSMNRFLK